MSASAVTGSDAGSRASARGTGPVGRTWLRLVRVTWRQHKASLLAVAGLFAVLTAALVVQGVRLHAAYAALGLDGLPAFATPRAASLANQFSLEYYSWGLYVPRLLMLVPLLVGAFVGGPLIARELESGTYRFAWTQGVGRTRLTAAKLVVLGLTLTLLALAFSAVFSWWYRPFDLLAGRAYEVEGIVFAARTLFGFTLGALVGAVLRRTVAAVAVTMAAWFAVVAPTALLLRPRFLPPITGIVPQAAKFSTEWTLSQWWVDPSGHRLSQSAFNALVRRINVANPSSWLVSHHYVQWETYQPASRFWSFQLIEASGLVLLALALAFATLWWVRRRAS